MYDLPRHNCGSDGTSWHLDGWGAMDQTSSMRLPSYDMVILYTLSALPSLPSTSWLQALDRLRHVDIWAGYGCGMVSWHSCVAQFRCDSASNCWDFGRTTADLVTWRHGPHGDVKFVTFVTFLRQSFSFKEGQWSGVAIFAIWPMASEANFKLSPDHEAVSRFVAY